MRVARKAEACACAGDEERLAMRAAQPLQRQAPGLVGIEVRQIPTNFGAKTLADGYREP